MSPGHRPEWRWSWRVPIPQALTYAGEDRFVVAQNNGQVAMFGRTWRMADGLGWTDVSGLSEVGDVVGASELRGTPHAFMLRDGHLAVLKTLGFPGSYALDANADGIVVGQTGIEGSDEWFPVVWQVR